MEEKRLRRSTDKMVAGVAAGLAEYFSIDPVIMRIAFVALALMGGPGLVLYIVMWIVMPEAVPAIAPTATPTPPADASAAKS